MYATIWTWVMRSLLGGWRRITSGPNEEGVFGIKLLEATVWPQFLNESNYTIFLDVESVIVFDSLIRGGSRK